MQESKSMLLGTHYRQSNFLKKKSTYLKQKGLYSTAMYQLGSIIRESADQASKMTRGPATMTYLEKAERNKQGHVRRSPEVAGSRRGDPAGLHRAVHSTSYSLGADVRMR